MTTRFYYFLMALLAFCVLALFMSFAARADGSDRMRHLAGERGCSVCHREEPSPRAADEAAPLAPSWQEIAARYRGHAGAEKRLTRVVMQGSDPAKRHWTNRLEFNSMQANPRLTAREARALVRWILSQR